MMGYLILALLGVLFVDVVGYVYHRFIEHGRLFRKIAHRHAIHHMTLYPPEDLRPDRPNYETKDLLSWYLPSVIITLLVLATLPHAIALPFLAGGWIYGLSIDLTHRLFHRRSHFLDRNRAFLTLQRIHDIHHVNQKRNFTIVMPLLDLLGGSFKLR